MNEKLCKHFYKNLSASPQKILDNSNENVWVLTIPFDNYSQ